MVVNRKANTWSVCILAFLLHAGCGSPPTSVNQKQKPTSSTITVTSDFPTKDNCGMIHYVCPVYPKEAKKAHIQGVVKIALVISKTGEISELHVTSGNPALVPAAVTAVRQWRYAPCLLNNEPVEMKTEADVPFSLNQ